MMELRLIGGDGVDRTVLDVMKEVLVTTFPFDRTVLGGFEEPGDSFIPKRAQHDSATVLRAALAAAKGSDRVLGVTSRDLCTPVLSFVFGQAQLGGTAAVVSLARLSQEFHGLSPDRALLLERARKEAVHEIGHTFGLTHCARLECAMSLSTGIREVDYKSAALCAYCERQVRARGNTAGSGTAQSQGGIPQ